MATLTFLGAAGTVTGSRHLLTTAGGKRVLVDAGLFQGRRDLRDRNWEPWTAGKLDAVLLTHAHIDHSGYLPRLVGQDLVGRVLCTEGTREIAALLLPDSAHLQEEDARIANERGYSKHRPALPLYTSAQAQATVARLQPVAFDQAVEAVPGVDVTFRRAGHIVGSAFLEVRAAGKRSLPPISWRAKCTRRSPAAARCSCPPSRWAGPRSCSSSGASWSTKAAFPRCRSSWTARWRPTPPPSTCGTRRTSRRRFASCWRTTCVRCTRGSCSSFAEPATRPACSTGAASSR